MNRGSAARFSGRKTARSCFNEAPIHESGKSRRRRQRLGRLPRFNEAPIHESGKYSSGGDQHIPSRPRFNEAPIHESGKWQGGTRAPLSRAELQ